jgi:hypothetical protein
MGREFPPSVTKTDDLEVSDGIIAYLAGTCGGNVHDHGVVDVPLSRAFSDTWNPIGRTAAKNVADLEVSSHFVSVCRDKREGIRHTRDNWVRHDFKDRRIVPHTTQSARLIRFGNAGQARI